MVIGQLDRYPDFYFPTMNFPKFAIFALLTHLADAGLVIDYTFDHLSANHVEGEKISDATRAEDASGNRHHGFYSGAGNSIHYTGMTPSGTGGVDFSLTPGQGGVIIRDNLNDAGSGSPNSWWGAGNTPVQPVIGSGESWTIEAVINFQGTGGTEAIIANNGGGSEWWWRVTGGDTFQCLFADSNSSTGGISHNVPGGFDNDWHHVALVLDRSAGELRSYYDYVLIGTTSFTPGDFGAIGNATRDLEIGQFDGTSSRDFDGQMDRLRISDEVLSVTQFVGGATSAPTVNSFTASQMSVSPGDDVMLTWDVDDASSIEILGMGFVSGNLVTVNPEVTTTYTLTATNNVGLMTSDVTVTVIPFLGDVADTRFQPDRGFYETPQNVVISTDTPGAAIHYTTDGSVPSESNGTLYSGPILVDGMTTLRAAAFLEGYRPTNVDTHTYLFLSEVLNQPSNPAGFPSDWGTHTQTPGNGSSFLAVADYEMDTSVATLAQLEESLSCLPVVSIVMDRDDLFDEATGIYSNPMQDGSLWERATSVELIHADGTPGFQEDAGIRMQGAAARRPWKTPKHSFRLLFKDEYGAGKLDYPLFPDSREDQFNTLVLRAGFNDAWTISAISQSNNALYLSDQWARDSHRDMGQVAAPGRFVHLYLGGLYWGVYNLMERPDAAFQSEHQGGGDADWDVVKHGGPQVVDGSVASWNSLYGEAVDSPLDYDSVLAQLDVESLVDYMLVNFYSGTNDWLPNNWYAARGPSGKYQFFVWDTEMGFNSENHTGKSNASSPARIYSELRDSAEFRMLFADRAQKALFLDGALTITASQVRLQSLADQAECAMRAESARWGDVRRSPAYTYESHWVPEFNQAMSFLSSRGSVLLGQLRSANLFPDVDAPIFAQYGGSVSSGYELVMTTDSGVTYYTADDSDPRAVGGAVSGGALVYSGAMLPRLMSSGLVKARTLSSGEWSALTEARFVVGVTASAANLVVSEIHYRPGVPTEGEDPGMIYGRKDFEFLELMNISEEVIELSDVVISGGIVFDFNTGSVATLNPGARVVVVGNAAAFGVRYPEVSASLIAGEFQGSLSNDGELLRIEGVGGSLIREFTYNDQLPWPTSADGEGYSLVLGGENHGEGGIWCPSAMIHGTPGGGDGLSFVGAVGDDEDGDGLDALIEYALGTSDQDGQAGNANLGGVVINGALEFYYRNDLRAKEARLAPEFSVDLVNWSGDESMMELVSREHNGDGTETARWRSTMNVPRLFMRLKATR